MILKCREHRFYFHEVKSRMLFVDNSSSPNYIQVLQQFVDKGLCFGRQATAHVNVVSPVVGGMLLLVLVLLCSMFDFFFSSNLCFELKCDKRLVPQDSREHSCKFYNRICWHIKYDLFDAVKI